MRQDTNQHISDRSLDRIRNHSSHHDKGNEFECKMIQMRMDGESDLVLWPQVRKRWRPIKSQSLIFPLVPEDDDLNATVIEVMTDIEVLLHGSSIVDVFAV